METTFDVSKKKLRERQISKCQRQKKKFHLGGPQCLGSSPSELLSGSSITYMHFRSTAAQKIYKS